jgi:hypothetical protein
MMPEGSRTTATSSRISANGKQGQQQNRDHGRHLGRRTKPKTMNGRNDG